MKCRWTILFWSSLTADIGMSWLAHRLGLHLLSLMTASAAGMVVATCIAFFAMVRNLRVKWPATTVLICVAPMGLNVVRYAGQTGLLFELVGPSYALVVAGTIATLIVAFAILLRPLPAPLQPPPVAPARLVD